MALPIALRMYRWGALAFSVVMYSKFSAKAAKRASAEKFWQSGASIHTCLICRQHRDLVPVYGVKPEACSIQVAARTQAILGDDEGIPESLKACLVGFGGGLMQM